MTSSKRVGSLPLSLRFNGHFPGGPVLAGTKASPFWILLELRVMEVEVTTAVIRRAQLKSNHHHQQTNTQLFTGRMPFLSPKQQCQSAEGRNRRIGYCRETTCRDAIYWNHFVAEKKSTEINRQLFLAKFQISYTLCTLCTIFIIIKIK